MDWYWYVAAFYFQENMLLVYEINNLRRELKVTRDRILAYENTLGILTSSKNADQSELKSKLYSVVVEKDEMTLDFNKEMEVNYSTNYFLFNWICILLI